MAAGDRPADAALRWAACGAMALSGRAGGPPRLAPGRPALLVDDRLAAFARSTAARTGAVPELPSAALLGERAALLGLRRRGPFSCGGAFRAVPAADGWFGLSLARPEDRELIPALTAGRPDDPPWAAVTAWAAGLPAARCRAQARELGLPAAVFADPQVPDRAPVQRRDGGPRRAGRDRPLVVDLTSLWAGPLCAHLLGLAGCEVVKVEDRHRLDGTRRGPAEFFALMHGGHAAVAVDLSDPADRGRLHRLLHRADLVLESSRARALARRGIVADEFVAAGVGWLSITARGRADDSVGFGDDVAVSAGLAVPDGDDLLPVGDALADPLTGVTAAAAAAELLATDRAALLDVSMEHVARHAAAGPDAIAEVTRRADGWWVHTATGSAPVAPPRARTPRVPGPAPGADNGRYL